MNIHEQTSTFSILKSIDMFKKSNFLKTGTFPGTAPETGTAPGKRERHPTLKLL